MKVLRIEPRNNMLRIKKKKDGGYEFRGEETKKRSSVIDGGHILHFTGQQNLKRILLPKKRYTCLRLEEISVRVNYLGKLYYFNVHMCF